MKRGCGDCTLCCTVLGVRTADFEKPKYEKCPHECGSCSIHATRPDPCATFECVWLHSQDMSKTMPRHLRPDKCHVVIAPSPLANFFNAWVDSRFPGAWKYGETHKFLLRLSQRMDIALTDGSKFWRIKGGEVHQMEIISVDENGYQQLRIMAPDGAQFAYDPKAKQQVVVE